jgi:hypothetical protein
MYSRYKEGKRWSYKLLFIEFQRVFYSTTFECVTFCILRSSFLLGYAPRFSSTLMRMKKIRTLTKMTSSSSWMLDTSTLQRKDSVMRGQI